MMFAKRSLIIYLIVLLFLSCDKKIDVPSRVQLLTKSAWKLDQFLSTPSYPIEINGQVQAFSDIMLYYRTYNPCYEDQQFTFGEGSADRQYQYGEYNMYIGKNKCSGQVITTTGTWYIHENTNGLFLYCLKTVDPMNINIIYTLNELSNGKLIMTYKAQIQGSSQVYDLRETFIPVTN